MRQGENRRDDSEPPGICQRLFNFITSTLAAQSFKRLTNPQSPSNEVPVHHNYHPENSNSEIRVDFRHVNGVRPDVAKKDKDILNGEKGRVGSVDGSGVIRPTRNVEIESGGKPPKKAAGINGSGGENEKNKNKDKNVGAPEAGGRPLTPPRGIPFLDNDINGRADEFIRQRKLDFLGMTTTLEQPKKSK